MKKESDSLLEKKRHGKAGRRHGKKGMILPQEYAAMDINSRLILNLRDLGDQIRFLFEGRGSQKRVLILLLENGEMTQKKLTEKMGVQPGSASEVIGKLEAAGLIERKESEGDRRTADVTLSEQGIRMAKEAKEKRIERHQEMFCALSEEEKETLLSLAEKLNASWQSLYQDSASKEPHPRHKRHKEED